RSNFGSAIRSPNPNCPLRDRLQRAKSSGGQKPIYTPSALSSLPVYSLAPCGNTRGRHCQRSIGYSSIFHLTGLYSSIPLPADLGPVALARTKNIPLSLVRRYTFLPASSRGFQPAGKLFGVEEEKSSRTMHCSARTGAAKTAAI